jgi:hypothetical protein
MFMFLKSNLSFKGPRAQPVSGCARRKPHHKKTNAHEKAIAKKEYKINPANMPCPNNRPLETRIVIKIGMN